MPAGGIWRRFLRIARRVSRGEFGHCLRTCHSNRDWNALVTLRLCSRGPSATRPEGWVEIENWLP